MFNKIPLSDSAINIIDGDRGKNYPKQADFAANGYCLFLSAKNITKHGFDVSETQWISAETDSRLRKGKLQRYDIVLTTRGTVGNVAWFNDSIKCDHVRINSGMVILRTESTKVDAHYLYQVLKSKYFASKVQFMVSGSAQPQLPIRDLLQIEIPNPSICEQRAIAHILGTLDDKIELNQKMNQTLEDIAKAIFKSWFVNFDPVRAKVEGRLTNLNSEISDFFPDNFMNSEVGPIPAGWRLTTVGEISKKESLKVKKHEGAVKVLSAVSSGNLILSEEYFNKQVFSKNIDNYFVVPKLAFAYNPSRINIGSIGLNALDINGAVSPVYSVFSLKENLHWFFQEWLNLVSSKNIIASLCSGSVRQSLKHSDLESIPLVVPDKNLIVKFNHFYELFEVSKNLRCQENETLTELRDTLVPKLISGELRIPDAEKFLEEAGI